jgi:LmbE family N-acetylglucosaminyl deacetylase
MKKMLLVFAHPDDESFACGGTVAKYIKAGWTVDLVCATRGEVGKSGEYGEKTTGQLGSIRQGELEKACKLLGISSITLLGYMDGTLHDEPAGELEDKIYLKMEELVPDCVITFDTTGLSNHPDHVRICYSTTFAFQKYATWIEKQLEKDPEYDETSAPKLYYACVPETTVDYLKQKKIFTEESFGKPWLGTPDKFVTTAISLAGFQMIKKKALRTHISQKEEVDKFLSLPKNPLLNQEYYIWRMHGTREIFMGKNDRIASKL